MEPLGRPRTAAKVQTRLHLDRSLVWRRTRDPLGEFLLIGPHPPRLSFARDVLHVPHRQTPFPSRPAFGGLYKHLRGSSYRRYRVGWVKSGEEKERGFKSTATWIVLQAARHG